MKIKSIVRDLIIVLLIIFLILIFNLHKSIIMNICLGVIIIILLNTINQLFLYNRKVSDEKEVSEETYIKSLENLNGSLYNTSNFDEITGLPTRKILTRQLEKYLKNNTIKNKKLALILMDLDKFQNINDTYGHEVGDNVLRRFSNNLKMILNKDFMFARLDGDEFAIIISDLEKISDINTFLKNILNITKNPMDINGDKVYCNCSMGISIYPNDGDSIDALLKSANMALYKAKENGRNRYEFFDSEIFRFIKREYEVQKALREAIDNNELYMMFQPKIDIVTENIKGFEALVRWENKELGFVSPGEFIPIAEKSGFIVELGKFIIDKSFKKCKELYLSTSKKFHIAINISAIQLGEDNFVEYISYLINKYELPPEYLEFEITESVIMESVEKNIETLLALKKLGVSIALDDFGTGYSSLSYLRRLPIDVLKIDKSFLDGIGIDEKSECIAESIIKLSHNLDLEVVAEGVETYEQLGYLNKMNCDIAQGYYFGKPERFEKIKNMI